MRTLIVKLKNGTVLKIPDGSLKYCSNGEWAIFDKNGVLLRKVPNDYIKDEGIDYADYYY